MRTVKIGLVALLALYGVIRAGMMPEAGYQVAFRALISSANVLGVRQDRAVLRFYKVNCLPYRYPSPIVSLATSSFAQSRLTGVRPLFTCN